MDRKDHGHGEVVISQRQGSVSGGLEDPGIMLAQHIGDGVLERSDKWRYGWKDKADDGHGATSQRPASATHGLEA